MIHKSYLLEQNLESIYKYKIFLFYGENQGLKKEFKEKIKTLNKDSEILNLFQEEILKNKDLLFNEIKTQSLFNKERIFLIDEADDKIIDLISEIDTIIKDERIYIFSNILEKKSKLRNYFEKSKNHGTSACYADNEITIKKIILNKLRNFEGLSNDIVNLIIHNTGTDRNKINNEIDKIKSCFLNKKINIDQVTSLLNLKVNEDFNQLRDEALNGNRNKTNKLLASTIFEGEDNVYYLNLINQRVNKLREINELKKNEKNIEVIVNNLRPPVFWMDKPTLIEQSKKWNGEKISEILKKTYNIELQIKSSATINKNLLIKNLLIDLCINATSS